MANFLTHPSAFGGAALRRNFEFHLTPKLTRIGNAKRVNIIILSYPLPLNPELRVNIGNTPFLTENKL